MGFPTTNLITDEQIISEFICPICVQLVEDPIITVCTHVFCKSCWEEWLAQVNSSSKCPKCNACFMEVPSKLAAPLRTGNALAWRILSRVQVKCPLDAHGCQWRGEYSEIASHLTSSESHFSRGSADSVRASAEAFKAQGNQRFEARSFKEAVKLYSKAITLDPSVPSYYSNRAAAWLMLGAYHECISDCKAAIELDPTHARAHIRLSKALMEVGDLMEAHAYLAQAAQKNPEASELSLEFARVSQLKMVFEEGKSNFEKEDYAAALECFQFVEHHCSTVPIQLWVAKASTQAGLCDSAISLTLRIIKKDDKNAEAFYVRGLALFYGGDMEQGVKHLKESLRLDPDQSVVAQSLKSLRAAMDCVTRAKECALKREFEETVRLLSDGLDTCKFPAKAPLLAAIFSDRASANLRLQQFPDALRDCYSAIQIQDDHKEAWIVRANTLIAMGKPEEAREDMSRLLKVFEQDNLFRHWYDKADFEVRKRERPDYYAILRVSTVATESEIKSAYKRSSAQAFFLFSFKSTWEVANTEKSLDRT
eukprot:765939-Hanusia_phi.AAC.6